MTTVLDEPVSSTPTSPAQRLKATMAATRVSIQWFGILLRSLSSTSFKRCRSAKGKTGRISWELTSAGHRIPAPSVGQGWRCSAAISEVGPPFLVGRDGRD
jgi:hypothetical protein